MIGLQRYGRYVMDENAHRLGRRTGGTVSWFHKRDDKSNLRCLYCGEGIAAGGKAYDKEHLIGRDFAPFDPARHDQFNFLFRACRECNGAKSRLEDHLSAYTLVHGPAASLDPALRERVLAKAARSFHPARPGVPLGAAWESERVQTSLGAGASMSLSFGAPTPPSRAMIGQLALRHVQGLFALATTPDYLRAEAIGWLPPPRATLFDYAIASDWGNPQLVALAERVRDWPSRVCIDTAGGNFRAVMRRDPEQGWFWALEWNRCLRVFGAIAFASPRLFEGLPELPWKNAGPGLRFREEIAAGPTDEDPFAAPVADSFY